MELVIDIPFHGNRVCKETDNEAGDAKCVDKKQLIGNTPPTDESVASGSGSSPLYESQPPAHTGPVRTSWTSRVQSGLRSMRRPARQRDQTNTPEDEEFPPPYQAR